MKNVVNVLNVVNVKMMPPNDGPRKLYMLMRVVNSKE